ncbi:MAG: Tad domain-containing protein, partial [Phycisphaerales bacterium]|nr:Tad domain-containing protein [Phycisphaerales bacterium]
MSRSNARGLVVIWAVVFLILILAFVSMGIEYAWLVDHQVRAQTAAEASSLAGVQKLGIGKDDALAHAKSTARLNPGPRKGVILQSTDNNSGGDITFGRWMEDTRTFVPDLLASNAMKITVKFRDGHPNGPVRLIYGDLLGGFSDISATATAHRRPMMPVPDRLWVLGNSADSMIVRRNGLIRT